MATVGASPTPKAQRASPEREQKDCKGQRTWTSVCFKTVSSINGPEATLAKSQQDDSLKNDLDDDLLTTNVVSKEKLPGYFFSF